MASELSFFNGTSKPYLRWWWLCGPITQDDIVQQLTWIRDAGFGGVELAWIHPAWLEEQPSGEKPIFGSAEWSELVAFTKGQANALGLGCDFTFGSCWPFGGSWLRAQEAAQTFVGPSEQRLKCSWEFPLAGPTWVLNHLSAAALDSYAGPLLSALKGALAGSASALFCDSLEVATERLWSPQLWAEFEERFGYALGPHCEDLDTKPDIRYDYRKLIADAMRREFYQPFTALARANGAYSRVQCHGAPTDLLAAYASADVPESEALLFPPSFSRIAASAAAWTGQPIVSAETFTCIYGFPDWDDGAEEYWKRENIGDLKLLADALFANGVNQVVWHGMPYQPSGKSIEFYASVHVGPDSPFAAELPAFNRYLESISSWMKRGRAYGNLGVYLPWEDALMRDRLPEEARTPGANFHWEMRHAVPPWETEGFHPLWISHAFLCEAAVENGSICSRDLTLRAIYVDCQWLDAESLKELHRLAVDGANLIWKQRCCQPGHRKTADYQEELDAVLRCRSVQPDLGDLPPLLAGDDLPFYSGRVVEDDLLLFVAHPATKQIRYPMRYSLSSSAGSIDRELLLRWNRRDISIPLRFAPNQSLLLLISAKGAVQLVQTEYFPPRSEQGEQPL